MTTRQRQATGSANAPLSGANGAESGDRALPFSWHEWFGHASAPQRAAVLGLAQQQGVLYLSQLAATANGAKPAPPTSRETELSALLARLLASASETLPALSCESFTFFDNELDALQRHAVVRALTTPDLFLLQGLPGAGKSRVLTEIILQSAARGRRVLMLSAPTASLDVILERLAGRSEIFALRFLDTAENLELHPAWLRGFAPEEQKKAFLERVCAGARGNRDVTEAACRSRREEEPRWAELHACLARIQDVAVRSSALEEQIGRLAESVEREVGAAFAGRLAERRSACDGDVLEIETKLTTHRETLAQCDRDDTDLAGRLANLEPAYRAKKHKHFWTAAFWLNLFNSQLMTQTETLLEQQSEVQTRRQHLAQEIAQFELQRQARLDQFTAERSALLSSEIDGRRQTLVNTRQSFLDQAQQLDIEWKGLGERLGINGLEKTTEAIATAHRAWLQSKDADEERCHFANQWSKFIDDVGPRFASSLPNLANLIATTIRRWNADAKLRDSLGGQVDLVILEDAATLTDADILKLSRHAQRCILTEQVLVETPDRNGAMPAANAFQRLWQAVGGDAGDWPCTWRREKDRLICQLIALTAEDRQLLDRESLADAPDIELGILQRPRAAPCLAEVTFATHCTFADAFTFMVREVQEFPLEPLGRTAWWSEVDSLICRHFGPSESQIGAGLELEAGVRLIAAADAGRDSTRIARIEFSRSAGWDRVKAENWLQRHRPHSDTERTAFLQSSHRFRGRLGEFVRAVVCAGEWLPTHAVQTDGAGAFEFNSVPHLHKPDWPREGAGLELDLSSPRLADRLPAGLRQGLPAHGYVNYLEAQALVRRLETICQKDVNGQPCRIAVLALYEGQVELLRRLVAQSEFLRNCRIPLEIALPTRLEQREFDMAFLSLTRSHGQHAVSFGEDTRELPLALTRARSRLFLFGDPGTLHKRVQCHGPLDQLDAHAAEQEQLLLSRMVNALQAMHVVPAHANGRNREPAVSASAS